MTTLDRSLRDINAISYARSSLMGLAMLGIMVVHSKLNFQALPLLRFIKEFGFFGADIFLFLSGFGLITSWVKKKPATLDFYWLRFKRIFPIYWLFLSIELISRGIHQQPLDWLSLISSILAIDFFVKIKGVFWTTCGVQHWFVSTIVFCYLIFPFWGERFITARSKIRFLLLSFVSILCIALALTQMQRFNYLLISLLRIPSFLLGIAVGYVLTSRNTYSKYFSITNNFIICLVVFIITYFIFYSWFPWKICMQYGLYWYPCIILVFPFTLLAASCIEWTKKIAGIRYIATLLSIIGQNSFALYFVHLIVFSFVAFFLDFNTPKFSDITVFQQNIVWCLAIVISIFLTAYLQKFLAAIYKTLYRCPA